MSTGEKSLDERLEGASVVHAHALIEQHPSLSRIELPRDIIRPAGEAYAALIMAGIDQDLALQYITGHLEKYADRSVAAQQELVQGIYEFASSFSPQKVREIVEASFPDKPKPAGEKIECSAPSPANPNSALYDPNSKLFKECARMHDDGVELALVKHFLDSSHVPSHSSLGEHYDLLRDVMAGAPANTAASVLKELYEEKPLSGEALLWLADPVPSRGAATYTLPRWITRRVKETLSPQPWSAHQLKVETYYRA